MPTPKDCAGSILCSYNCITLTEIIGSREQDIAVWIRHFLDQITYWRSHICSETFPKYLYRSYITYWLGTVTLDGLKLIVPFLRNYITIGSAFSWQIFIFLWSLSWRCGRVFLKATDRLAVRTIDVARRNDAAIAADAQAARVVTTWSNRPIVAVVADTAQRPTIVVAITRSRVPDRGSIAEPAWEVYTFSTAVIIVSIIWGWT